MTMPAYYFASILSLNLSENRNISYTLLLVLLAIAIISIVGHYHCVMTIVSAYSIKPRFKFIILLLFSTWFFCLTCVSAASFFISLPGWTVASDAASLAEGGWYESIKNGVKQAWAWSTATPTRQCVTAVSVTAVAVTFCYPTVVYNTCLWTVGKLCVVYAFLQKPQNREFISGLMNSSNSPKAIPVKCIETADKMLVTGKQGNIPAQHAKEPLHFMEILLALGFIELITIAICLLLTLIVFVLIYRNRKSTK